MTKGYGISVTDIDGSCPADLEPYAKAHRIDQIEKDSIMHRAGFYNMIAFEVVMSQFGAGISGKRSNAKYPDNPISAKEEKTVSAGKESNEEIAVFEMKKRIKVLQETGMAQSPA